MKLLKHKILEGKNMSLRLVLLLLTSMILTGCSSSIERLQRVGKNPDLAQMDMPIDETQPSPEEKEAQNRSHMRRTNSLWQPGSTSFFRDNRAWRVGDILKVSVNIRDSANLSNTTAHNRTGTNGFQMSKLFGKEKTLAKAMGYIKNSNDPLPTGGAGGGLFQPLSLGGSSVHSGNGSIARQENIQTDIAAVVRKVMPNGNLVIEGHQEVRVNSELREVKIAGIIRPRDITSNNSINSDQIAEARISYGGRGAVSDYQNPQIGTQVVDIISPF